ncbi:MAG: RelA/SpoT domain-containing protein [Kineosporiaceae bacterium]
MLVLPMSKTMLTRIGERVAYGQATDADEDALEAALLVYDRVREAVWQRLRGVDWGAALGRDADLNVTSRTKSRGTILDKIQREERFQLGRIHDLAGVRLDGAMCLDEQDRVAARICELFPDDPKLKDRRPDPTMGYRALHVIVRIDALPCEVQVRTHLQHSWANLYEAIGDVLGRWIRYPDAPMPDDLQANRDMVGGIVAAMRKLSQRIATLEQDWNNLRRNTALVADVDFVADAVASGLATAGRPEPDASAVSEVPIDRLVPRLQGALRELELELQGMTEPLDQGTAAIRAMSSRSGDVSTSPG